MFCLPKNIASTFLERLKTGEINPEMLTKMTSQERRAYFSEFMGDENAKQVNTLLESKLILKDQQKGLIKWAEETAGIKPEIKKSIVDRINKMDKILTPENEQAFLADLAEHKLGVAVTMDEAANISELARFTAEARSKMLNNTGDRMIYGRARIAMRNYINGLKEHANALSPSEYLKNPVKFLIDGAGNAKAINASLDNSAILRQGWRSLLTHPGIWFKNAIPSFGYIIREFSGKNVLNEIDADIISRPTYDKMVQGHLAVNTKEEAYPISWAAKVPILGKFYRASEAGFVGFSHRLRADLFDYYLDVADKSNVNLKDPQEVIDIAKLVNSLTGRGNLGPLEPAADTVNNIFFSPRFVKSHIDTLLLHPLSPNFSAFARKEAGINLLKIIIGTSAIFGLANSILPGVVELDSRSADFGKIKIGKTRFDITGGMASLVILASRWIQHSTKSSMTGRVHELDTGRYGGPTTSGILYDFFSNKLSPVASVLNNLYVRKVDYKHQKYTLQRELPRLVTPLMIANYQELKNNPDSADLLVAMIADAVGISTNTY